MKFIRLLFVSLGAFLLGYMLNSCSKDETTPVVEIPFLTVTETEFTPDADWQTYYSTVASNQKIIIEQEEKWCNVELMPDAEENNLKITVMANAGDERTVIIFVTAPNCEPVKITVTQAKRPAGPFFSVSADKFSVESGGKTLYATVTSNVEVTVKTNQTWCTTEILSDVESDNLKMVVEANPDLKERTAIVTLSAQDCADVEITLTQIAREPDKSNTCDLLTFHVDGATNGLTKTIEFDFDKNKRTLTAMYLKWIDKADPAMLIPTFTTNGQAVLVNGKLVTSGETKISFADDIAFVVAAENGDTKTYTITLNCPQINTELPAMRLQPDRSITSQDIYVGAKLDLTSPTTASGWWSAKDAKIEVRGRGNSTWGLPKKPYRIKFPEKYSPIGLNHASARSWVILAHDMDKSLIRNHMALEMSRVMFNAAEVYHDPSAIMFTPCSQFVNVYMNNDYLGLYQMSDQMERNTGRIAVEKLNDKDGADATKITGGHIIETDIHGAGAPKRFNSSRGIQMNHKYPEDDAYDPAQYTYIENFIRQAENALFGSNFKHATNGWRKYLDEKTLADFIIIKEFAGDMDGYTSTYMYKRRGVDKIFFGPIWDCDKGWDNDKRVPHGSYHPLTSLMINAGFYMPPYVSPDWFHRIWQDETFRAFVAKRWTAKKAELTTAVMKVLDEQPVRMAKAIEANYTKWQFYYQYSQEANLPAQTYEKEIERLRRLTNQRATLLDQLFNK